MVAGNRKLICKKPETVLRVDCSVAAENEPHTPVETASQLHIHVMPYFGNLVFALG